MSPLEEPQSFTIVVHHDTSAITGGLEALQEEGRIAITDDASFATVARVVNAAKDRISRIKEFFRESKELANRAHKAVCANENTALDPYIKLVGSGDAAMKTYRIEQKRSTDEARRIADAAVQKANAERAQAAAQDVESKRLEAERLRDLGRIAEAKTLETTPVVMPVAMPAVTVIERAAPKVAGINEKWPWTAKVVDKMEIIRAVAEGKIPLTYGDKDLIEINETLLRALAKQRQKDFDVPGAVAEPEPQFARSRS